MATIRKELEEGDDEDTPKNESRPKVNDKDDDDSDSDAGDGGDGGDGDFNSSTQRAKHADEHEYDEDEDKDVLKKKSTVDEGFGEDEQDEKKGQDDGIEIDEVNEDDEAAKKKSDDQVTEPLEEMSVMMEEAMESRKMSLLDKDPWIIDYEFDIQKSLNCRLTLSVGFCLVDPSV